jgi:hypothetical protein
MPLAQPPYRGRPLRHRLRAGRAKDERDETLLKPPCGAFYRTHDLTMITSSFPTALHKIDTDRSFAKP